MNPAQPTQSPSERHITKTLREVPVREVMVPKSKLVTVPPEISLRELVDDFVLPRSYRGFPVVECDCVLGLISTDDFRETPKETWTERTVRDAMVPLDDRLRIEPEDSLATALKQLDRNERTRLLVMKECELLGLVTAGTIYRFVELESLV